MATTIQISEKLQSELKMRKLSENESYEEIIWDMIEDTMEISKETRKMIRMAEAEIKAGKVHALAEVKRELNV